MIPLWHTEYEPRVWSRWIWMIRDWSLRAASSKPVEMRLLSYLIVLTIQGSMQNWPWAANCLTQWICESMPVEFTTKCKWRHKKCTFIFNQDMQQNTHEEKQSKKMFNYIQRYSQWNPTKGAALWLQECVYQTVAHKPPSRRTPPSLLGIVSTALCSRFGTLAVWEALTLYRSCWPALMKCLTGGCKAGWIN